MDYEIAHINFFRPGKADDPATETNANKPIVDWHTDSYPFVCILMLSDCTGMIGGETVLRTGTGEPLKIGASEIVFILSYFCFPLPKIPRLISARLRTTRAAPSSSKAATSSTKPFAPTTPPSA